MTAAAHPVTPHAPRAPRVAPVLAAAVLVGLFSAGMWFAWLGWDHQYYEVDGVPQGPYRAWQVVGCGVAIVVATVLAQWWARHWLGLLLLPAAGVIGFAVPWSFDAASTDETGLWVVGLVMILAGGGLGLLAVVLPTYLVRSRR